MDPIALEKIKMVVEKTHDQFADMLNLNDINWLDESVIPKSLFPSDLTAFDMEKIQLEIIHFYDKICDMLADENPDFRLISQYFESDLPSLVKRYILLHHKFYSYSCNNCLLMYHFIQADYLSLPNIESVDHFSTLAEWRLHINQTMISKYSLMFQIARIDLPLLQSIEV